MGISPGFGYFRLGTEQSGNVHTWRVGVVMQAQRLREALAAARAAGDTSEADMRLDADLHFLLVAIRNGVRFAERIQEVVNDKRLGEALAAFTHEFPQARDLRDVGTHLDEYVLDEGNLQPTGKGKRKGEVGAGSSSWRAIVDGELVLGFGPFAIKPLVVAAAAERVLGAAAEAWLRGLREGVDGRGAVEDDDGD